MLKRIICLLSVAIMVTMTLSSCNKKDSSGKSEPTDTSVGENLSSVPDSNTEDSDNNNEIDAISFTHDGVSVTEERFFATKCSLAISAPEGATVYYSTDGSEPNSDTGVYSEPISLNASIGDFPTCLVLKAKAVYSDGSESETVTHSFFCGFGIGIRFSNVIFSLSGDPDDLFNKPDGIFYGKNYEKRGKESERPIYVEAISSGGDTIFEQGAGVRIYGAASRSSSIKSLKLFARKSYDPEHGKFAIDVFDTPDVDGESIDKYDKLVLRNAGNDFQFAYIRDELNQRLAQQAGYTDYEGVVPVVTYLNGKYYGLLWLHETYCDDLLKDKYGKGEGSFEVIEGSERNKKTDDDDTDNVAAAEEYNELYNRFAYSDLTDNGTYANLCEVVDVENYLQNYAYNIYINNNDWPQNNYKCYRYYAADGEEYSDGALDGRWRYIFHDTDYCMGLYEQNETAAGYNNLSKIMNEHSDRYSPLFTALMARDDCREYFLSEIKRLMNDVLSSENIIQTLDDMNFERYSEMQIYYKHLEEMKQTDSSIWSWYDNYLSQTEMIKSFAKSRAKNMKKFLIGQFELSEDYFD